MAQHDHMTGCPCGLQRQCDDACEHHQANRLRSPETTHALRTMMRLSKPDKLAVLRRLEQLMTKQKEPA